MNFESGAMRLRFYLLPLLLLCAGCATRTRTIWMLDDFGPADPAVAVVEASILKVNPDARIRTITHDIEPFQIAQGAYVLQALAGVLPPGDIVLGIVDPGVGGARSLVVVEAEDGVLLVGPDNGLFAPYVARAGGARAIHLIQNQALIAPGGLESTYVGRDVVGPIAARLSLGLDPAEVGPIGALLIESAAEPPRRVDGDIYGNVLLVDRFGNLHTDIPSTWIGDDWRHNKLITVRPVEVDGGGGATRGSSSDDIRALVAFVEKNYDDAPRSFGVIIPHEHDFVEVAVNLGSAAETLRVRAGARLVLHGPVRGRR